MSGKVYLVGAGPGDEGLITVKGLKRLKEAEVVIYDYLANPILLKHCKLSCEKIYVGKKAGNHTATQEDINQLIIEKAKEEKTVVRLKGGDPYVFGRGGEEGECLYNNSIDFEVIPGISSSIGGLAYSGIPVTFREVATSFHVITGHLSKEQQEVNYNALAVLSGTLVFLMGISNMEQIVNGLIEGGKSPNTPAAIVYQASTPKQQVEIGVLENIVSKRHTGKSKPGIIVIGEVLNKREALDFYSRKPLMGKKIIVTRATTQASSLVEQISELGGEPIELPTIEIKEIHENSLKARIDRLDQYSHLIFTSQNAVDIFMKSLFDAGYDARHIGNNKITAVGAITSRALLKYCINADYMAKTYDSESLIDILKEILKLEDKILIPRSKKAKPGLVHALSKLCFVDEVSIYDTIPVKVSKEEIEEAIEDADFILFTSASTVENFMNPIKDYDIPMPECCKLVSIGPMTSEQLKYYGYGRYLEADQHTVTGMIDRLLLNISKGEEL